MKLPFLPARAPCYRVRALRRTGCYPRDQRAVRELREIIRGRDVFLYRGFSCCGDVAIALGMYNPARKLPTPYYLL